jgi:hypothetical protein
VDARRSQGKRRPKVIRIHEELECAEWPKRMPPQALRDMKVDGDEVARTEKELYVEMRPGVGHMLD